MEGLYAAIFSIIVCSMCVGHGLTSGRFWFAAFFSVMTAFNAIAIIGHVAA